MKQPLYHNTSTRAKENLLTAGADFERSATAAYGRGFYLATAPIKRYGPAEIRVAVDLRNPLDVDLDEFDLRMNDLSIRHISLFTEVLTVINLTAIFHNTVHLFELFT